MSNKLADSLYTDLKDYLCGDNDDWDTKSIEEMDSAITDLIRTLAFTHRSKAEALNWLHDLANSCQQWADNLEEQVPPGLFEVKNEGARVSS